MKLSNLINILEEYKKQYSDIDIQISKSDGYGGNNYSDIINIGIDYKVVLENNERKMKNVIVLN